MHRSTIRTILAALAAVTALLGLALVAAPAASADTVSNQYGTLVGYYVPAAGNPLGDPPRTYQGTLTDVAGDGAYSTVERKTEAGAWTTSGVYNPGGPDWAIRSSTYVSATHGIRMRWLGPGGATEVLCSTKTACLAMRP